MDKSIRAFISVLLQLFFFVVSGGYLFLKEFKKATLYGFLIWIILIIGAATDSGFVMVIASFIILYSIYDCGTIAYSGKPIEPEKKQNNQDEHKNPKEIKSEKKQIIAKKDVPESKKESLNKSSLSEEEFKQMPFSEKISYEKEWKCTCNECNHVWHYLASVEKKMDSQISGNSLIGLGMCCNPCIALSTSNANTKLEQEKQKLKSCPKCGSSNVSKEAKYHKRQI